MNSQFLGNVRWNTADIENSNGYDFLNLERRAFLQTLYDCLPDKAVVKAHQRITNIIEDENGVQVVTVDGTVEHGDILIGCDGVKSTVRNAMWANADRIAPGLISSSERRSKPILLSMQ